MKGQFYWRTTGESHWGKPHYQWDTVETLLTRVYSVTLRNRGEGDPWVSLRSVTRRGEFLKKITKISVTLVVDAPRVGMTHQTIQNNTQVWKKKSVKRTAKAKQNTDKSTFLITLFGLIFGRFHPWLTAALIDPLEIWVEAWCEPCLFSCQHLKVCSVHSQRTTLDPTSAEDAQSYHPAVDNQQIPIKLRPRRSLFHFSSVYPRIRQSKSLSLSSRTIWDYFFMFKVNPRQL